MVVTGRVVVVAVAMAMAASWVGAARQEAAGPAFRQFDERVNEYRKLRARVEAKIGHLPKTDDPAEITRRERALGEAIREARADARQGDLFVPPIAIAIRRIVERDLARRRSVERHAIVVEQPDVDVHVNDFYPTSVPLATVPPRLLTRLPRLPDGLQYRFAGRSMILLDVDPNLIVDVLPDAIPARYGKR